MLNNTCDVYWTPPIVATACGSTLRKTTDNILDCLWRQPNSGSCVSFTFTFVADQVGVV